MGTWNASLYGNDYACDIRDDYIYAIRSRKESQEAAQELVQREKPNEAQADDAALFWLALADTQWNYGVLEHYIRDNALRCCEMAADIFQWDWKDESDRNKWLQTIHSLENKLRSPQPPKKQIRGFRSYICPWAMGDVFAYRLSGADSREFGALGKYIIFRKVSELRIYPMHVNPIIHVFFNVWETIPTLDVLKSTPLLPSFTTPKLKQINPDYYWKFRDRYYYNFTTTSKRQLPVNQITFLGNWIDSSICPIDSISFSECMPLSWEGTRGNNKIEKVLLEQIRSWQLNDIICSGITGDGYCKNE